MISFFLEVPAHAKWAVLDILLHFYDSVVHV